MKQIALITGGSRGIGYGIATHLAKAGFELAINGVRAESEAEEQLQKLRDLGAKVIYCQGNIGVAADRISILENIKAHFGYLNVLVNNAGIAPVNRCDFLEVTEENFDALMDVNQKGTFFLTQLIVKYLLELKANETVSTACVVNITSVSALAASTQRAEYCMSKASLSMLSKVLAVRLAPHDIPVYEIQPGIIDTDMITKVRDKYVKLAEELVLERRMGTPDDIGKIVTALVTGQIPYATGQVISPDGGMGIWRF